MCISLFWPRCSTCGILVLWPGIEPGPSAERTQSPNHWATREVPRYIFIYQYTPRCFPSLCLLTRLSSLASESVFYLSVSNSQPSAWLRTSIQRMNEWYKTDLGKLVELGYSMSIFFIRFDLGSSVGKKKKKIHLQCRRPRFDPWVGRIPRRRKWQPTLVFLSEKSHGQEPGRLQSMGLQRVGHDLVIKTQKIVCEECIYPVSRHMMASLPAANCKIPETAGLLSDLELNLHQFLVGLEKQKEIPETVFLWDSRAIVLSSLNRSRCSYHNSFLWSWEPGWRMGRWLYGRKTGGGVLDAEEVAGDS